jgi:hypothetical protein
VLVARAIHNAQQNIQGHIDAQAERAAEIEEVDRPDEAFDLPVDRIISWVGRFIANKWTPIDKRGQHENAIRVRNVLFMYFGASTFSVILALVCLIYDILKTRRLAMRNLLTIVSIPSTVAACYYGVKSLLAGSSTMYTHRHRVVGNRHVEVFGENHHDLRPVSLRQGEPDYNPNLVNVEFSIIVSDAYVRAFPDSLRPAVRSLLDFFPNPFSTYDSNYIADLEYASHISNIRTSHPSLVHDPAMMADKIERAASSLTNVNVDRNLGVLDANTPSNTVLLVSAKTLMHFSEVGAFTGFRLADSLSVS